MMLTLLFLFDGSQDQLLVEMIQEDLKANDSTLQVNSLALMDEEQNKNHCLKEADQLVLVINDQILNSVTKMKLLEKAVTLGKPIISIIPENLDQSPLLPSYLLEHRHISFKTRKSFVIILLVAHLLKYFNVEFKQDKNFQKICQELKEIIYLDPNLSHHKQPHFYDVFISYGRPYSTEFCKQLKAELNREKYNAWLDLHNIPDGEDWKKEIEQNILNSHVFIFVISPKSIKSEYCNWEIDLAVKNNKRFIPLLHIDQNELGNINQLIANKFDEGHPVRKFQWIDFKTEDNFDQGLQKLIRIFQINRNYLKEHTRLLERGREWIQHNRNPDFLLRGKDLKEAKSWLERGQQPTPTQLHIQYINVSSSKEKDRKIRNLWMALLTSGLFIGVIAVFGLFRISKKEQISALLKVAESPYYSNRIDSLVASLTAGKSFNYPLIYWSKLESNLQNLINKPQISWMNKIDPELKSDVATAVQRAIYWTEEKNQLLGHELAVLRVSFSDGGKLIASASRDGNIKLWNQKGKLLQTLEGHQDTVYHVAFSLNDKMLISSSKDGKIKLWKYRDFIYKDANKPQEHLLFTFFKDLDHNEKDEPWEVNRLELSPDGQLIASASELINKDFDDNKPSSQIKYKIKLWNLQGTLIESIPSDAKVTNLTFSSHHKNNPKETILAAVTEDGYLQLWKLKDGEKLQKIKKIKVPQNNQKEYIVHLSFSPDGEWLVGGTNEGSVVLLKRDGTLLSSPSQKHKERINALQFSPTNPDDKMMLATASDDETIKLWNLDIDNSKLQLFHTLEGHKDRVWRIQFSHNGYLLASASYDNSIKLWQRDGSLVNTLNGHQDLVNSLSFSPDNKTLASASYDHTVKLWRLDKQFVKVLPHERPVLGVNFATIKPNLITIPTIQEKGKSTDFKLGIWGKDHSHNNTWKLLNPQLNNHDSSDTQVHTRPILTLDVSQPIMKNQQWTQLNASGSEDGSIKLWDEKGQLVDSVSPEPQDKILAVSFSPNGQFLASATENAQIQIWRVNQQKLQPKQIISQGFGEMRFGKIIESEGHEGRVFDVEFTPDNQFLVSAGEDGKIKLWTLDRRLKNTLKGDRGSIFTLDFSRNKEGILLASGGEDNLIKLWKYNPDERNFTIYKELKGHLGNIRDVRFSPDGKLIASASDDQTIKLWTRDGELLMTLKEHRLPVRQVSFSIDGRWLASGSDDNRVILWQLPQSFLPSVQTLNSNELKERLLDELLATGCELAEDYLSVKAERETSDIREGQYQDKSQDLQEIDQYCRSLKNGK